MRWHSINITCFRFILLYLLYTHLLEEYTKFHSIWSIISAWLQWKKQFFNAVFKAKSAQNCYSKNVNTKSVISWPRSKIHCSCWNHFKAVYLLYLNKICKIVDKSLVLAYLILMYILNNLCTSYQKYLFSKLPPLAEHPLPESWCSSDLKLV